MESKETEFEIFKSCWNNIYFLKHEVYERFLLRKTFKIQCTHKNGAHNIWQVKLTAVKHSAPPSGHHRKQNTVPSNFSIKSQFGICGFDVPWFSLFVVTTKWNANFVVVVVVKIYPKVAPLYYDNIKNDAYSQD